MSALLILVWQALEVFSASIVRVLIFSIILFFMSYRVSVVRSLLNVWWIRVVPPIASSQSNTMSDQLKSVKSSSVATVAPLKLMFLLTVRRQSSLACNSLWKKS